MGYSIARSYFRYSQSKNSSPQNKTKTNGFSAYAHVTQTQENGESLQKLESQETCDTNPQAWYLDTGTTHYLTSNQHLVQQFSLYLGDSTVILGNGYTTPITYAGNAYLT